MLMQWSPDGIVKGTTISLCVLFLKTQRRGARHAVVRPADIAANVLQILISEEHEPQGLQLIQ